MDDHEAKLAFQPGGYCPGCDYRTDEGICPECGLAIGPGQLRKTPRTWLHKHARALLVTAAVLVGVGWFARARPELVPYFPAFYLLDLQVSSGPLSSPARKELAKRYAKGRLSQTQLTRFVMQWADVSWHRGGISIRMSTTDGWQRLLRLHNSFVNRGFPISSKIPLFSFEESVGRLTLDRTEVPLTHRLGSLSRPWYMFAALPASMTRGGGRLPHRDVASSRSSILTIPVVMWRRPLGRWIP